VSVFTDEILFTRVVKNLIDNGLKYSLDARLDIFISESHIRFENRVEKTLSETELLGLQEKSFSKSFEEKRGIGIPMLSKILIDLWYELTISSSENKFIVEIRL